MDEPVDLEEQDRLLARIRKDAGREHAGSVRSWKWLPHSAAAAAGLAAVIITVVWIQWPRTVLAPAPLTAQPAPGSTSVAAPAGPAYEIPLDKPPITLSTRALTWRGTGGGDDEYLDALKPGLDSFRAGEFERAANRLEPLEVRYPRAIEVFYYGGVAKLFAGNVRGALESLEKAERLADDVFAPEVAWYLAAAEQRAGQIDKARAHLAPLCKAGGSFGARACEAIKQLVPPSPAR